MNRYSRLQSKTPLKAKTELKRKTPMPRAGGKVMERKATKKATRPKAAASKPVAAILKTRSDGLCEVGLVCLGGAEATDTAHRMGKQSGGVGKKNTASNQPANLLRACRDDHDLIDRRDVRGAEHLGLKVRHGIALPAEMPVRHHRYGWVLLDDEGGVWPAPRAAWHREGAPLPVIAVAADDFAVDVFAAVDRWGHADCGGFTSVLDGECVCRCGTALFVVAELEPELPLGWPDTSYGSPSDLDEIERAGLASEWSREASW